MTWPPPPYPTTLAFVSHVPISQSVSAFLRLEVAESWRIRPTDG